MDVLRDCVNPGIAWKRVDWNGVGKRMEVAAENDGGWDDIRKIVDELPRKTGSRKRNCGWWNSGLERMAGDLKCAGWKKKVDRERWNLIRRVYRCNLIHAWYEYLKERLAMASNPEIFKMVKCLSGTRTVPYLINENNDRITSHEDISEEIGKQLGTGTGRIQTRNDANPVEIDITIEDLKREFDNWPKNTAAGHDGVSYPFLRMWFRKYPEHMLRVVTRSVRGGQDEWKDAMTILIPKAGKITYNSAKSWRMIHLLSVISKVIDRIILHKMTECIELGPTQFGSRKRMSCQDCVKICKDFLEYHEYPNCAMMTMDIAGGFDNIDRELLKDILTYRGCDANLVEWVGR